MVSVSRIAGFMLLLAFGLSLTACQESGKSGSDFDPEPIFGDGLNDSTPVVARIGDVEITQKDLDLRYDELPPKLKAQYEGEEGQRLLLKDMVEQALMVLGAGEQGLYNDSNVARTMISQRRNTLDLAMRNIGLFEKNQPTEDEIKEYFDRNRNQFRQEGMSMARHVECLGKVDADAAYARLLQGGIENDFPHVVKDYSRNIETGKNNGEMGWFNKGGFIPFIANSKEFTSWAADLEVGLHPPYRLGDRWHVVEILKKEYSRPMTFGEAKGQILQAMLPAYQDQVTKEYLQSARAKYAVEMLGRFAPGKGMTPESIFARGMALADPEKKLDMFDLVVTDFPTHDKADDALFMSAMVAMDSWQDRRVAEGYLTRLLQEYPDSELAEDARFLQENLYDPKALSPKSIEELRK